MANAKEVPLEVATILSLIKLSEDLHTLPTSGGLLDQDSLFIYYYMYVAELREMRRQLDEHKAVIQQNGQHARAMGYPARAR